MNDPVKMMEVKELKIERQFIEAKMKKNRKEGEAKNVKTLILSLYGGVDTFWIDECSEEQLMKALTITRNNFTYEQFQDEMMRGISNEIPFIVYNKTPRLSGGQEML